MQSRSKQLQKRTNSPNSEGYLIAYTAGNENKKLYIKPSCVNYIDTRAGDTCNLQISKQQFVHLYMPPECALYFLHIAQRGTHIDLREYAERGMKLAQKRIQINSPEYYRFQLPMRSVTPDDIVQMQDKLQITFASRTANPTENAAEPASDTQTKPDKKESLQDRFLFLSDRERADLEAKRAIKRRNASSPAAN